MAEVGKDLKAGKNTRVVDAAGMLVLPGFVDLHAHFRTPGREDEEDIATASAAAAAGGYVAAFGMANTDPVVDNGRPAQGSGPAGHRRRRRPGRLLRRGDQGARGPGAHRDGRARRRRRRGLQRRRQPLPTAAITRRALQYVKVSKRFIAIHAQDASLFKGGQMHEGPGLGTPRPHRHPVALREPRRLAHARHRRLRGRRRARLPREHRGVARRPSRAPRRRASGSRPRSRRTTSRSTTSASLLSTRTSR